MKKKDTPDRRKQPGSFAGLFKIVGPAALGALLAGIAAFLAAGRIDWIWAWVSVGISLLNVLVVYPLAMRIQPGAAAEPGDVDSNRTGDTIGNLFHLVATNIALPLVAGLDERFAWSGDLGLALHGAGTAVLAAGSVLAAWAAATNAYTWSEVTVQRGQTVCRAGPYRFVRHPAYAGSALQALGVPLLLGSLWALIPGIAVTVFMIIATRREDRALQAALPGYRDYAREVRFRLLPLVW